MLLEYNKNFAKYIIYNCSCYKKYIDFTKYVFINRNSYLCCICICIDENYKIMHLKFPIMIGSLIDDQIRGISKNDEHLFGSFIIEGIFKVINYFSTNNLTNGYVYSIRSNKKRNSEKVYLINLHKNNIHLKLKYNPNNATPIESDIYDDIYTKNEIIKKRYAQSDNLINAEQNELLENSDDEFIQPEKKFKVNSNIIKNFKKSKRIYTQTYKANLIDKSKNMTWMQFIQQNSPFPEIKFTENDYTKYFDACLQYAPKLDELSNKTCISPSNILNRILNYLINEVKNSNKGTIQTRLTNMSMKLTLIFLNGNMFFVLSSKIDTKILSEYKTIYQSVESQKLHLISELNVVVKRSINAKTRNSAALEYPEDGFGFYCPIDTKDIKGAGENMSLAQLVISPPAIEFKNLIPILNKLCNKNNNGLQIVINSFLTHYYIDANDLILLKKACPILPLMMYGAYLNVSTIGHVVMKYSDKYNFFVTPYEYRYLWTDAFEKYHNHLNYSPCAMYLPSFIELAQPAKRVVSHTTIKGRSGIILNKFNAEIFIHTISASAAAIIHRIDPEDKIVEVSLCENCSDKLKIPIDLNDPHMRYYKFAEKENKQIPQNIIDIFEKIKKIDNIYDTTECYGMSYNEILDNANKTITNILRIIDKWQQDNYILIAKNESTSFKNIDDDSDLILLHTQRYNILIDNNITIKNEDIKYIYANKQNPLYVMETTKIKKDYNNKIKINPNQNHPPHITVYACYGDFYGGTDEDGVIIDKTLVENGPFKLISTTLSVKFSEIKKKLKKNKTTSNSCVYIPINSICDTLIMFGLIESPERLSVTKSKNVTVIESKVGNIYRYFISITLTSIHEKVVESSFNPNTSNVTIHFRYVCTLGVGIKISNLHGQKGIVCKVEDLSDIIAYKKDGTIVHPQILYSSVSIVGRTTSSQIMSMLNQKDIAFTENGDIIALQGINIHNIEASIKSKKSSIKNDLMTTENGYISNKLPYTNLILQQQGSIVKNKDPLHLIQQLLPMHSVVLNMLSFNQETLNMLEEKDVSDIEKEISDTEKEK
uniref:DNA-directed RNA polymerase n=1 Tax=Faxonius propinquus nudivirus TaxID=3139431 RepID=A0AAU8GCY0_9VIRU